MELMYLMFDHNRLNVILTPHTDDGKSELLKLRGADKRFKYSRIKEFIHAQPSTAVLHKVQPYLKKSAEILT